MLSFQPQNSGSNVPQPIQGQSISQDHTNVHQQIQQHQQQQQQQHQHQQPGPTIQTMRLRDEPPAITPVPRTSRKRKSPPSNTTDLSQNTPQPPQPPPQQPVHVLPPPHAMIHPPPHLQGPLPHPYQQYAPTDYTPGGMPPQPVPPQGESRQHSSQSPPPNSAAGRALSSSKRAEQNRKAQRAFRERRDQHVKALESRSQLLDAALASADEANRRWEECRALVDQLRVENAALRAALSQAQLLPQGASNPNVSVNNNGAHQEGAGNPEGANELKNDSAQVKSDQKD